MTASVIQQKRAAHLLEKIRQKTCGLWSSNSTWWRCLGTLTAVAMVTRLTGLQHPPGTSWDEVHFGTFGNNYINRTFFHDVHPPLGKMLVAAAMHVSGYQATFPFSIATLYPHEVNYVLFRAVFAVLGAALVPLAFLTVWQLTESLPAALLAGAAVLTDHYLHRLCTLILLDAPLLLSILASVYCSFAFHNTKHRPGSLRWWGLLASTGACLGIVMSVKYVGVFTVVFVGLHTAYQLYVIVMDPEKPLWHVIPHTLARAACLIVLPVMLYLSTFVLHFAVLSEWEPNGGGFYHARFVSSFNNTEYDNQLFPKHVDYGSNISMKSSLAMSGYLESWFDLFPSQFTAPCQQVTITTIRDDESVQWTPRFVNASAGQVEDIVASNSMRRVLRNGDHLVLTHQSTQRSLRSHGHRAPLTKRHYQVCGYGDEGQAGPFETWQIIVPGAAVGVPLEAMRDEFMLKHYHMKCYLANPGNVALPDSWAYQSAKEVTCTKNSQVKGLLWHINWINGTKLPLTRKAQDYSMGLWEKIVHQHEAMILGNSGLKPSEIDLNNSARPWMWPFLFRLQTLCAYNMDDIRDHRAHNKTDTSSNGSSKLNEEETTAESSSTEKEEDKLPEDEKNSTSIVPNDLRITSAPKEIRKKSNKTRNEIYAVFMHNPVVAYINLLSFAVTLFLVLHHFFTIIRGIAEDEKVLEKRRRTVTACFWVTACWAMHYVPFFTMSRILYSHHYCPAYCYSCMLSGIVLGHLCEVLADNWSRTGYRDALLTVFIAVPTSLLVASYVCLYPLATHMEGRLGYPNKAINTYLEKLHFGQNWNEMGFDDGDYLTVKFVSRYEDLQSINLDNTDVNVTLYYGSELLMSDDDYGQEQVQGLIAPVAASNYSLWWSNALQAGTANGVDIMTSYSYRPRGVSNTDNEDRATATDDEKTGNNRIGEPINAEGEPKMAIEYNLKKEL